MAALPVTTAHLRVQRQSFADQCLEGDVQAGGFNWQFSWFFDRGELSVEPSLEGTTPSPCGLAFEGVGTRPSQRPIQVILKDHERCDGVEITRRDAQA